VHWASGKRRGVRNVRHRLRSTAKITNPCDSASALFMAWLTFFIIKIAPLWI